MGFCVWSCFFFSSRRRHTRCREVSWARRCVQETERRVHGYIDVHKKHYIKCEIQKISPSLRCPYTQSSGWQDTPHQILKQFLKSTCALSYILFFYFQDPFQEGIPLTHSEWDASQSDSQSHQFRLNIKIPCTLR
eukprot:TRINITY_DN8142_c0_g1_i1.p1 TRINITY_DN8142_c0_g1~~TRINITY_DN8142_c0_g1_i1.p1  ORF type:complete len:135 (+),score=18.40 TRINITY_DN8142_c0_g1_i1:56-460(+)